MKERLSPEVFRLPIEKIRAGYKSDVYFNRTKQILTADQFNPTVTMQLFQKIDGAVVCGIDHALAILYSGTGFYKDPEKADTLFGEYRILEREAYKLWLNKATQKIPWKDFASLQKQIFTKSIQLDSLWVSTFDTLSIRALYDGDKVISREPVMHIEGSLRDFVNLETLYLGALTDGTCVATNTSKIVEAAGGKPVLMFGARHKSHESQAGDGYAAFIGGARGVSTDEQGEYWGSQGLGTIPHALIAAYGGSTVLATEKFDKYINGEIVKVNVTSLVDFDNDCVGTALAVARKLGNRLWGVRLDTSENMVDKAVWEEIQDGEVAAYDTRGVNSRLVYLVRRALDKEGFGQVKIVVSGGFTPEKIRAFETLCVPVDAYGVGSALFEGASGKYDYTADVVKPIAKTGRKFIENKRLEYVDKNKYSSNLLR